VTRRRAEIIAVVVILALAGVLLAVWLGDSGGDSGTTTLELTSS